MFAYNGPNWILIERHMTPEELAEIGAVEVIDDGPTDGGYWAISATRIYDLDSVPHSTCDWEPWSIEGSRRRAYALLAQQVIRATAANCPVEIVPGLVEHLQMRDAVDLLRWTNLRISAFQMQLAGYGDQLMVIKGPNGLEPMPIKTEENNEHVLTVNVVADLMTTALSWNGLLLKREWVIKNAIDLAADQDEMDAVIATMGDGWPE